MEAILGVGAECQSLEVVAGPLTQALRSGAPRTRPERAEAGETTPRLPGRRAAGLGSSGCRPQPAAIWRAASGVAKLSILTTRPSRKVKTSERGSSAS